MQLCVYICSGTITDMTIRQSSTKSVNPPDLPLHLYVYLHIINVIIIHLYIFMHINKLI